MSRFSSSPHLSASFSPESQVNFPTDENLRRREEYVPDYIPWAILALISLCFPLGIVAMGFCIAANTAKAGGNYPLAKRRAKIAKILILWGFFLGLVIKGGLILQNYFA